MVVASATNGDCEGGRPVGVLGKAAANDGYVQVKPHPDLVDAAGAGSLRIISITFDDIDDMPSIVSWMLSNYRYHNHVDRINGMVCSSDIFTV